MTSARQLKQDFQALAAEMTVWRQHLHAHPELSGQEFKTAAFIEEKLQSFGYETFRLGKTGVVALLEGTEPAKGQDKTKGRKIMLRADTDALPIPEETGLPYASTTPGVMHGCGHDGHTAMLLGAAKYLRTHNDFQGTVYFLFQPAEEDGTGGPAMIEAGLFEKFDADEIYGLHNIPAVPLGLMGTTTGDMLSAADAFRINFHGKGGHAGHPERATNLMGAAARVIVRLQDEYKSVIRKGDKAVLSVASIRSDSTATNVLPNDIDMAGTFRSFSGRTQRALKKLIERIMNEEAEKVGATATITYECRFPKLTNSKAQTKTALRAARDLQGFLRVLPWSPRQTGTEDFAALLQKKPGNYMAMGSGDPWKLLTGREHGLHSPLYDFNDKALPLGAAYWVQVVKRALPSKKTAKTTPKNLQL